MGGLNSDETVDEAGTDPNYDKDLTKTLGGDRK
jgi:hypothetical protein